MPKDRQAPAGATDRSRVRCLLALTSAQAYAPAGIKANNPSRWLATSNRADLLLITHNTLASEFALLATLRRAQGWRVEVIEIEDVYDEIGFGSKPAIGLGQFLAFWATM